jgi:hypothetical protein
MRGDYTRKERIKAGVYFVYQALTYFPLRIMFENYPNIGADLLSPRECLERTRESGLRRIVGKQ